MYDSGAPNRPARRERAPHAVPVPDQPGGGAPPPPGGRGHRRATPVLEELRLLATHDRDAKAGERLAARYRSVEGHGSADDALLELGQALHAVVLTNDQPLLDRLEALGVPRAHLRSRSHLVLEGL